ncbi:MAG: hypothetical protein IKZ05_04480 [Clostridia bacterium]|nr:hypothetical protein [Clostridia bacterium]
MKKTLLLLLALIFAFSLCSCTESYEKADEYANKFITALLVRDEEAMKSYIHPDYIAETMPNDLFYETLEKQFLTIGHPLTSLSGVSKVKVRDMDNSMKAIYVARVNELFYTVELIFIDNDNGYGIVSVAMVLNTELDYYYNESWGY